MCCVCTVHSVISEGANPAASMNFYFTSPFIQTKSNYLACIPVLKSSRTVWFENKQSNNYMAKLIAFAQPKSI